MAETYRSGRAAVTVEQRQLLTQIDRITEGAGTSFLDAARASLTTTTEEAAPQWMERTGATKRSFVIRDDISPDRVSVTALNTATRSGVAYPYKARFSVRLASELDAEVARIERGITQTDDERTTLKWMATLFAAKHKRRATGADLAHRWRVMLTRNYGTGAPSEAYAGKQAWSLLVRRPAKRRERRLIEVLRADLDRLAGD